MQRPSLGHSTSSCCLQYVNPAWDTVRVPATPLSVQLLGNTTGKAAKNGPNPRASTPTWETRLKLLVPGFSLIQPLLLQPTGERISRWKLYPLFFNLNQNIQIQCNPYQNNNALFTILERIILKIHMESQKIHIAKVT